MASPPASPPGDLVGRTVADGRYEVVRQIGRGGMGTVYLARQVAMDRMVALKLISVSAAQSAEAAVRFEREMRLTAKIEHPNTIRVYDFGEIDGQLYLTMELLRGQSLGELLAASPRLPLERIVRIATQVTRALQAAHAEGVVHRDLKPDNVMLIEQYGEHDVVKVLDFGVAKSMDQGQVGMTATGAVIGTPVYLSPEQAKGEAIDARSDLYSLGVVLFQMATGRLPFTASSVTGLLVAHVTEPPPPLLLVAPETHPGLAALVDELLRKEPDARPPSAREVEARLEAIAGYAAAPRFSQQQAMMLAATAAAHPPLPRPTRRRARWGIAAALVVGAGVGALVLSRAPTGPSAGSDRAAPRVTDGAPPQALAPTPGSATVGSAEDPARPARVAELGELVGQLAAFDDPPPPAACAGAAAVDAARFVLDAREAIARDAVRAVDDATRAIARCPSFAAAHNIHGNALQKTGRLDEAADAYARALTFAPDYEAPRFNLGVVQLRRKDSAAIATFGEVIRRKPELADAYKSRGQAYLNAERYPEALADFEDASKRADDGRAWLIIGQLRDRLHRPGARDAYCKAQALGVDVPAARCPRSK